MGVGVEGMRVGNVGNTGNQDALYLHDAVDSVVVGGSFIQPSAPTVEKNVKDFVGVCFNYSFTTHFLSIRYVRSRDEVTQESWSKSQRLTFLLLPPCPWALQASVPNTRA